MRRYELDVAMANMQGNDSQDMRGAPKIKVEKKREREKEQKENGRNVMLRI